MPKPFCARCGHDYPSHFAGHGGCDQCRCPYFAYRKVRVPIDVDNAGRVIGLTASGAYLLGSVPSPEGEAHA